MADGLGLYIFSFGDADGVPADRVIADRTLKAQLPAPTIVVKQGQELYLTMTNVGMVVRPDLFDPHSVHWHGFPNAAPIFDGLPEPSPTANMGNSMTYYYNAVVPGTFFYHCHVEAAEHMQMGMIGNLWVTPAQDGTPINGFTKFVYNDGDGSTGYDVAYPLLLTGFDSFFHIASDTVQALPFAAMYDEYPMINGRGYPDTINPNDILNQEGFAAQKIPTIITANTGQRILLRVCNISTTHQYTFATTLGVPMKVVGRGAAMLRGTGRKRHFHDGQRAQRGWRSGLRCDSGYRRRGSGNLLPLHHGSGESVKWRAGTRRHYDGNCYQPPVATPYEEGKNG